jgi:protein subunit release factor A
MIKDCVIELIYNDTGTTKMPGGQQAGTPLSSVRITHIPTGLMAQCGYERSQHKNRQTALSMLEYGLVNIGIKI